MDPRFTPDSDQKNPSAPPPEAPVYPGIMQYSTPMYQPLFTQRSQMEFEVPTELSDDFTQGKKELKEQGLSRQKAQLCVLLDVSLSMQNPNKFFYDEEKQNKVQQILNRILALAFSLDDNRKIEVIPFGPNTYGVISISRENYKNATGLVLNQIREYKILGDDSNPFLHLKDGTNYAAAIRALRKHYTNETGPRQKYQKSNSPPVYAFMLTDGNHNDEEEEAANQFKFASYQNIFIKTFGLMGFKAAPEAIKDKFEFLQGMDDLKSSSNLLTAKSKKTGFLGFCCGGEPDVDGPKYRFGVDNSDFVPVSDPTEITMELLIREFRGWLMAAYGAGIIAKKPMLDTPININDEGRTIRK